MSSAIPLSYLFNVSVATPQTGVGAYNTSNLAIFTRESYASSFGSLGYNIYLSPTQVGIDFGTASTTFAMANAIFSQQPNITAGGGYLVVIPMLATAQVAVQSVSFIGGTGLPTAGAFVLNYAGHASTSIPFGASQAAIQTAVQTITGLGTATVSGSIAAGLSITFNGVSGPAALMTVTSNTLTDVNTVTVVPTLATTTIGSSNETLDAAIVRSQGIVQYFGILATEIESQAVTLAAAAVVQPLNKMIFFTSFTQADVAPGGTLDLLRSGGFTASRAVPYFETNVSLQPLSSLVYAAAYAGLALSTNFNGSNTTQTMQVKTLSAVQPDPSTGPTLLTLCQAAGADIYFSVQGIAKVLESGTNDFFDNVYNRLWFAGAIQVAEVNALATTNTKIPQTEDGMDILKGAVRIICEQARTNQFIAPGSWTSSTTFGNQADLIANILQRGYYIYSSPISQQLPTARLARQATLIQVAIKYAGAIHSGSLIVNVNP
jgi:hypothetical protein